MDYIPIRYTDGTFVRPGDRIRYHQAPGGMLQDSTTLEWKNGTAVIGRKRYSSDIAPSLWMQADPDVKGWGGSMGGIYGISGHVIERLED